MDDKYRTFLLSHFGTAQNVAIYANNDYARSPNRDSGDVVVYITSGGMTCGLHLTPEQARYMADLLNLAADEALPVPAALAA